MRYAKRVDDTESGHSLGRTTMDEMSILLLEEMAFGAMKLVRSDAAKLILL
jgi:hypothetical protein